MAANEITVVSISDLKIIISDVITNHLSNTPNNLTTTDSNDRYLTREEVAKKLRISLPTLNTLTKENVLTGYRIGRRVLYKWSDVENCLTEISSIKYKRNFK